MTIKVAFVKEHAHWAKILSSIFFTTFIRTIFHFDKHSYSCKAYAIFFNQKWMSEQNIVAYRPTVKRSLCKQQPLLGNALYIHARNNITKVMQHISNQRIGKHVSTTIGRLLKVMFSAGSAPGLYNEDLRPAEGIERVQCSAESRAEKKQLGGWFEMAVSLGASQLKVSLWREDLEVGVKWPPDWELSVDALQGRLRRDGAIIELGNWESSVAGYLVNRKDLRGGSWRISIVRSRC
jgi:hypothetical protein